jgi:hypothetical protein
MITEAEQAEIHAMVNELDDLIDSGTPGSRAAWFKLKQLAETTGNEYEMIARQYLSERAAHNTDPARST